MTEIARRLEPGFSVADAEYPSFDLQDGVHSLRFRDWRERNVHVRFSNAVGVKWQELDSTGPEDRDDEVYEKENSAWHEAYLRSEARTTNDALRHYRLCFNALGVLDVLASSMEGVAIIT